MTTDPGASAERTRLAWRRTGLSAAVVALLAARPAFTPGVGPGTYLAAAAALAGWAALVGLGYRRARGLAADPPLPGQRTITAYAAITVAFALLGSVLVTF